MIGAFAFGTRVLLLAAFTFAFVVLFEHGPRGFAAGAPVELSNFQTFLSQLREKMTATRSEPAPVVAPAEPEPAPAESAAPSTPAPQPFAHSGSASAWEQLQARPLGEGLQKPLATPLPGLEN